MPIAIFRRAKRHVLISATTNALNTVSDSVAAACFSFAPANAPMGSIRTIGQELAVSVGSATVAAVRNPFPLQPGNIYHITAILGPSEQRHPQYPGFLRQPATPGYGNWYGANVIERGGQRPAAERFSRLGQRRGRRRNPGHADPRRRRRRGAEKTNAAGRQGTPETAAETSAQGEAEGSGQEEILEAIEAKGLGAAEKRLAISLIAEAMRLELPSLFYSQPIIHDKEQLAKAILFIIQQAMQRIADEEEDEEAALLLLSAA